LRLAYETGNFFTRENNLFILKENFCTLLYSMIRACIGVWKLRDHPKGGGGCIKKEKGFS
jgi:hypothetical protein